MDIKELKELDAGSLQAEINNLREGYARQKEAVKNGKEKNFASLPFMRREIARATTLLKEKQEKVD